MLIPVSILARVWGVRPNSILHVGGHLAEELEQYERWGWGGSRVVWVEANPAVFPRLEERISGLSHHSALLGLAWDRDGEELDFHVMSNSQSSSALEPHAHLSAYPEIEVSSAEPMVSVTLETLLARASISGSFDLLNLDVQGAELRALRGLEARLAQVKWVYSEVNVDELYRGSPSFQEVNEFLSRRGFHLLDWRLVKQGWGDALWARQPVAPRWRVARRFTRIGLSLARRVWSRVMRPVRVAPRPE